MLGSDSDRVWFWYIFRRWVPERIIIIIFFLSSFFLVQNLPFCAWFLVAMLSGLGPILCQEKIDFFTDDLLQPPSPTERTQENLPAHPPLHAMNQLNDPNLLPSQIFTTAAALLSAVDSMFWVTLRSQCQKKKSFFLILALQDAL
jgi:hypothetical protein